MSSFKLSPFQLIPSQIAYTKNPLPKRGFDPPSGGVLQKSFWDLPSAIWGYVTRFPCSEIWRKGILRKLRGEGSARGSGGKGDESIGFGQQVVLFFC